MTVRCAPIRAPSSRRWTQHCTKATFFMVGRMAVADPEMVREVASRGHTVGAHTWSHAKLQGLAPDKAKDEIELGFSAVARALQGPIAPFFRFPYLRPTAAAMAYLKTRNVASFTIDVDSRDFRTRDGEAVKQTVLAQLAGAPQGHPAVPRYPAVDGARAVRHPRRAQEARLQGRPPRAEGDGADASRI